MLDAGDQYLGTLYSSIYQGTEAAAFLNAVGVDAFVSGGGVATIETLNTTLIFL